METYEPVHITVQLPEPTLEKPVADCVNIENVVADLKEKDELVAIEVALAWVLFRELAYSQFTNMIDEERCENFEGKGASGVEMIDVDHHEFYVLFRCILH